MTSTLALPAPPASVSGRDPVVDLVRSVALVIVVLLHAVMAGVWIDDGGIRIVNAFEDHAGFAAATWALQIMPLFFIAGGFTALTQWRRMRAAGGTPADFVRSRVERLALPAAVAVGSVVLALAALTVLGTPEELVREIGYRIGQPLWFLAVFLLASCLVPWLAALHERAPRLTLGVLVGAAVAVDLVPLPGFGFFNLAFVWLVLQQLGFFWREGRIRGRLSVALGAYAGIGLLVGVAGYPLDMLVGNNNPPTVALILLGVAHLHLLVLADGVVRRAAVRFARPVGWIGARALTVYLWHMPVVVVLAAVTLGFAAAPLTASWWVSRPVWLVAVLVVTLVVADRLRVLERGLPSPARPASLAPALAGAVLATGGVVLLLVGGFAGESGVVAAAMLAGGVWVVREGRVGVGFLSPPAHSSL